MQNTNATHENASNAYVHFLKRALSQPELISALVIASLTMGIFAATTFMSVFALIGIGLVAGTLATMGMSLFFKTTDKPHEKQDNMSYQDHRASPGHEAQHVEPPLVDAASPDHCDTIKDSDNANANACPSLLEKNTLQEEWAIVCYQPPSTTPFWIKASVSSDITEPQPLGHGNQCSEDSFDEVIIEAQSLLEPVQADASQPIVQSYVEELEPTVQITVSNKSSKRDVLINHAPEEGVDNMASEATHQETASHKPWPVLDNYIIKQTGKLSSHGLHAFFWKYSPQQKLQAAQALRGGTADLSNEIYKKSKHLASLVAQSQPMGGVSLI